MIRTTTLTRNSLAGPLVDGSDQSLIAAWPVRNVPDAWDDFSLPPIPSPPSRRIVRGDQDEDPDPAGTDKPPSKAPTSKPVKKPESQAPKTKTPVKPESKAPHTKAPRVKPPARPEPEPPPVVKKPKTNDDPPKGESSDSASVPQGESQADEPNHPPQDDDINPEPDDAGGEPPVAPPIAALPGDADSEDENTPLDEYRDPWPDRINNEHKESNNFGDFLDRVGDYVRNLIGGIFGGSEDAEPDGPAMIPVALPPPRNPLRSDDPTDAFRDGRISQLDLESAAGRDPWTMCCAATFVYAVQTRYPGLSRDSITDAFGKAADKKLADESGKCVDDDGYVGSLYQFSQAFSANLGLDEYVDVSGIYDTVKQAQDAGADMVKVEYSGTIDGIPQEHHTLLVGSTEIDPIPGKGIDGVLDIGSKTVEGAMGLGWYPLP